MFNHSNSWIIISFNPSTTLTGDHTISQPMGLLKTRRRLLYSFFSLWISRFQNYLQPSGCRSIEEHQYMTTWSRDFQNIMTLFPPLLCKGSYMYRFYNRNRKDGESNATFAKGIQTLNSYDDEGPLVYIWLIKGISKHECWLKTN